MGNEINVKVVGLGVDANVTIREGEFALVALNAAGVELTKGLDLEVNNLDAMPDTPVMIDQAIAENPHLNADAVVSVAENIEGGLV